MNLLATIRPKFLNLTRSVPLSGISDRHQEIRRRRSRKAKLAKLEKKLKKATVSERGVMADKIRRMTPGANVIIENWGLLERK